MAMRKPKAVCVRLELPAEIKYRAVIKRLIAKQPASARGSAIKPRGSGAAPERDPQPIGQVITNSKGRAETARLQN